MNWATYGFYGYNEHSSLSYERQKWGKFGYILWKKFSSAN